MSIRRIIPAITIFLASCAAAPVHATTAVVPDSFPTIQAGIESWRDTVLVRGGHYDEDLVLMVGVTLAVLPSEAGGDTVETGGLRITEWILSSNLGFRGRTAASSMSGASTSPGGCGPIMFSGITGTGSPLTPVVWIPASHLATTSITA